MASTATPEREQIRPKAQRQRASQNSRHEISRLAHELLQKHLDERHAVNEQSNLEERARVGSEHVCNAGRLVAKQEKENNEFDDVRFAMIAEFDAQRDGLRAPLVKKLEEEGLRHTALLDSLQTKLAREDHAAEQELQKVVEEYKRAYEAKCSYCGWYQPQDGTCKGCSADGGVQFVAIGQIIEARMHAQQSAAERHDAYEQLVDRHKAEWSLRQDALRLEFDNHGTRQARLDLEYQFQRQFSEHDRHRKTIQERHAEELKELENKRDSTLEATQADYERSGVELCEERGRVDDWWRHLCDEFEAGLRQVQESANALGQEAAETVEAERSGPASVEKAVDEGEEWEREEAVEVLTAGNEDGNAIPARDRAQCKEAIAIVADSHETTVSQTAATSYPGDPESTLPNDTSHRTSVGDTSLLEHATQDQEVYPLDDLLHTPPTPSSPLDPQHELAAEGVSPLDEEQQSIIYRPHAHVAQTGLETAASVPEGSGSPESGGFVSEFVEIKP